MTARGTALLAVALLVGISSVARAHAAGAQTAAMASAVSCDQARAPSLHVHVLGARSDSGSAIVTLWGGDAARFLKHHGWIARADVPIHNRAADACFALSGAGTYALSLYHDENGNKHFDRSLVGMPEEGFGVSNDAPTPFGLPSFSATKFTVGAQGGETSAHLRY